jgi:hypothetical protein
VLCVGNTVYGQTRIPAHWLERLMMRDGIIDLADRLYEGRELVEE